MTAMRASQYQIVAVRGLFETEEQYQVKAASNVETVASEKCRFLING